LIIIISPTLIEARYGAPTEVPSPKEKIRRVHPKAPMPTGPIKLPPLLNPPTPVVVPKTTAAVLKELVEKLAFRVILPCAEVGLYVILDPNTANAPEPYYPPLQQGDDDLMLYVTYTKSNTTNNQTYPTTASGMKKGKVYSGRTRGIGTPDKLVAIRDLGHPELYNDGYGKACAHVSRPATLPFLVRRSDPSYRVIRGSEQIVIEKLGGTIYESAVRILSGTSSVSQAGEDTRSRNLINGISKSTDVNFYNNCILLATQALLSPFLGQMPDLNWDGVCPFP
jgi:hypothetical protein